ncbi:MAG TPA: hypothetical protein VMZ26_01590 [Pyrinomonadaceae bacterium]|nr:hypothetical protein [Pyrinomonadaceae bacterium]
MRIITISAMVLAFGLFSIGCNTDQTQQIPTEQAYRNDAGIPAENEGDEYWAKDNLDLERVGNLLERSDDPQEFEEYLNEPNGINNLDLNDDGYADYISVEEFDDRGDGQRGLSLFSRFGPDLIQEVATIFFHRDGPNYPGARVLINGNEQLYGDNNYYETNWLDRAVPLISSLFGNHQRYRSPYYYDNYPRNYETYQIVDTPYYRRRIEQAYPQPVFVYTTAPTWINDIKIKSPNNGRHLGQIKAKLAKPNKEQEEFLKSYEGRSHRAKGDNGLYGSKGDDKPGRDNPPRSDRGDERGNPGRDERGAQRGNPNKPNGGQPGHPGGGPPKAENPYQGEKHGGGNPNKDAGGNPNKGGGNPNKGGGGNPNKGGGGGNPNKGGGNGGGKGKKG